MVRMGRVLGWTVLAVCAATLLFVLTVNAFCAYHRKLAESAMARLRQLPPGEASESDFLSQTREFRTASGGLYMGTNDSPENGSFSVSNVPDWIARYLYRAEGRLWPPATVFWVVPAFRDSKLIRLSINEVQGNGHPNGAHIRWGEPGMDTAPMSSPTPFAGYVVRQTLGDGMPPWGWTIVMDQRATAGEREQALDLNFQCFTRIRACRDARLFLTPAKNRQ